MVVLNYTGGEINAKIVYYGPGVSGKTTNLEFIHEKTPNNAKGKMVSMKTQTDRTLFFDFLPLELGEINGYRTRFLLYTVPGQVYYNATRKLVLKGVDAVVFVADSSRAKLDENLESLRNLEQNLNEHGMSLDEIPWVIQYNKRDLPDAVPLAELDSRLNPLHKPSFEAVASKGTGVYETFHGIATMVYRVLKDRLEKGELSTEVGESAPAQRGPDPVRPGAKAPAARPKPAFTGTADPEIVPRAARPAAPAIREATPVPPPAEATGAEFEFDDHVDLVLREVEPKPGAKAGAPARPPAHAPRKAPEPTPTAPAKTPRRAVVGEVLEKTPLRGAAPAADAPADENLFADIPESTFDHELGRLPELDEASEASETAREEGPDEFVTDPMRRVEPKAAPVATAPAPAPAPAPALAPARAPAPPARAAAPARAPEAPRAAPAAPVASEPRVAPDAHTTQEVREVRVAVPLVLTRAQLEGGAPIRVVLDVRIVD